MRRIFLAFRAFFRILGSSETAGQVDRALRGEPVDGALPAPAAPAAVEKKPAAPPPPRRSEALTLLAALQREARFVDLVLEPLDGYSDAQVGAAARDVLRDCRGVLQRLFAIQPYLPLEENAPVTVPTGYDANGFRLTGKVTGEPPFQGRLVHPGWTAATCQLPVWNGADTSANVIAPAEVEVG